MNSHTVPQRLLQQFAYLDVHTQSLRLWRYERDRKPFGNASPKSATVIDGHFADPRDAELETNIEKRLATEIEDPVNQFISRFSEPSFTLTDTHRKQMTRYITLLFNRSQGRRAAGRYLEAIKVYALERFLASDNQISTVAMHWNLEACLSGRPLNRLVTPNDVVRVARNLDIFRAPERSEQEAYVSSILNFMATFDERMFAGEWKLVTTTSNKPFILSDSPVVTWERKSPDSVSHGVGVHEPNVEVFLPVSPSTCLHILPKVERSRQLVAPAVEEINTAQAAFAYRACFANQNDETIDRIVQRHISTAKIGENTFTLLRQKYDNLVYDILMYGGRLVTR